MKRVVSLFVVISILLVGCSSDKIELNIPEWLMRDELTQNTCENVLGENEWQIDEYGDPSTSWNDYELFEDKKGTLKIYLKEDSTLSNYYWAWTYACSEEEYLKIEKWFTKQYGAGEDNIESYKERNMEYEYAKIYRTEEQHYFELRYKEGILEIFYNHRSLRS